MEYVYKRTGRRKSWRRRCVNEICRFLRHLVIEVVRDQLPNAAAAVAFFAWLSIFPMLLIGVAAFGIWLGSEGAQERTLQILTQNLPALRASGIDFKTLLESLTHSRGKVGTVGVLGLLWTAMHVVLASQVALNRVFAVRERHGWLAVRARALLFGFLAAALAAVSLGSGVVLSLLPRGWFTSLVGWGASLAIPSFMFACAYRLLPRLDIPWRFALAGGVVTSALWFLANRLLSLYFADFNNVASVYGSFGGVVIVLLTCYYLAFVTLVGAEVTDVLTKRYAHPGECRAIPRLRP